MCPNTREAKKIVNLNKNDRIVSCDKDKQGVMGMEKGLLMQ